MKKLMANRSAISFTYANILSHIVFENKRTSEKIIGLVRTYAR